MTKEQITPVLAQLKSKATLYEVVFASDHSMISRADAIIWDDKNELVFSVRSNNDHGNNAVCPIAVTAGPYDTIQYMKGMYTMSNFEAAADILFAGLITAEQKAQLLKFVDSFRIHAIEPIRAEPYYTSDPIIIPNAPHIIKRDDGKTYKETNGFDEYKIPVVTPPTPPTPPVVPPVTPPVTPEPTPPAGK
ncbi:MAG: hypothetical protein RSC68_17510 [Acinetobacter sp.]